MVPDQNSRKAFCFNPRTYIRYDCRISCSWDVADRFNPRTYIRYDHRKIHRPACQSRFNPRTYIRYDLCTKLFQYKKMVSIFIPIKSFNPRTYIRYDILPVCSFMEHGCFNPRTYIRYDSRHFSMQYNPCVSIHVPI